MSVPVVSVTAVSVTPQVMLVKPPGVPPWIMFPAPKAVRPPSTKLKSV